MPSKVSREGTISLLAFHHKTQDTLMIVSDLKNVVNITALV